VQLRRLAQEEFALSYILDVRPKGNRRKTAFMKV